MEIGYAILVGFLFSAGVYGILRRCMTRMIVGIILLSQSINLLVFFSGGLTKAAPALLGSAPDGVQLADPLPQALVLTAIVIGFGLTAFVIVLYQRVYAQLGHDDSEKFFNTDS